MLQVGCVRVMSLGSFWSLLELKLILKSVLHSKFLVLILMLLMPSSIPLFTISPAFSQRCSKPTERGWETWRRRFFVTLLYTSTVRFTRLNRSRSIPAFSWCLLSQVRLGLGSCRGIAAVPPLYWLLSEYSPR